MTQKEKGTIRRIQGYDFYLTVFERQPRKSNLIKRNKEILLYAN